MPLALSSLIKDFACAVKQLEEGKPMPNVLFCHMPGCEKESLNINVKTKFAKLLGEKCGLNVRMCLKDAKQIFVMFEAIKKASERCMIVVQDCNELMSNYSAVAMFLSCTGTESGNFLVCGFSENWPNHTLPFADNVMARFDKQHAFLTQEIAELIPSLQNETSNKVKNHQ